MLSDDELQQIKTEVRLGVVEGIRDCPYGKDREVRLRDIETWRNKLNGERGLKSIRKRDLLYPFISAFLAAFLMFIIMLYWPK